MQNNTNSKKISDERFFELTDFANKINVEFGDLTLLDLAFHHRSLSNEEHQTANNERLEFLGDSVLALVTAKYLFLAFPNKSEGELSQIKSCVVSEEILSEVAVDLDLSSLLLMGKGEEKTDGRHKKAILADAVEAVIAAIFLDSGFQVAEKFVLSFIKDKIDFVVKNGISKDYKTLLQEFSQKKFKNCPIYEIVGEKGPDHEKVFSATVKIGNCVFGPKDGKSKKVAEENVAKFTFLKFKNNE